MGALGVGTIGGSPTQAAPPPQQGYGIQGNLPFQAGAGALGSAIGGGVGAAYTSAYSAALAQNQTQYQNILQGYQQTAQRQQADQNSILQRFDNLGGQVMNTIQGVDQSQLQAIQNTYAQQQGQTAQGLINSGLGNTTVLGGMQQGNTTAEAQAETAVRNQFAQLEAGYQSQLGSQAANYANQATLQNTALAGQQLNWMNSVQMQYPNAQSYQNAAMYQGQLGQQQAFAQQHPVQANQGAYIPQMHPTAPASAPAPQSGYNTAGWGDSSSFNYGGGGSSAYRSPFGQVNPNYGGGDTSYSAGGGGDFTNYPGGAAGGAFGGLPTTQTMYADPTQVAAQGPSPGLDDYWS
jgi:hypothetical protein